MVSKEIFYQSVRAEKLITKLSNAQVQSIDSVLNWWDVLGHTDLRWLAYMFATILHETAGTMLPINEYGKGKGRPYGRKLKRNGVSYTIPNKIYYGRGYVQLTWYENYELMGRLLNVDLLNNPELALEQDVAVRILFEGMLKGSSSFGDFTGRCLEQYFNTTTDDPKNARRIINGLDKAALIKGYHDKFLRCLQVV